MKNRRELLLFVLMMPIYAIQAAGQTNAPNILYIFSDDQSYRTVSCYPRSYNFANTPNIDRLAERGVRFDQAYVGAKCVPSRATALTGRLQFAVESNYDGSDIGGNTYWFPTIRDNGYYTGMIGKWHYGAGAAAHQHGISWDWSVVWDHGSYDAAGGYYYDQYVMIDGAPQVPLGGYSTDRYTDFTEQFIQERAAEPDKPWFYWLCYGAVHGPYTPADRHIGVLENEPETAIPVDIYGPRPGKPSHFQDSKWAEGADGKPYLSGQSLDFWVKQQTEAVAAIDESVGRIVQALEDTGQLDNTIIVFTADQGYVWGHHGLKGKIDPYETAIRSPFIVSNPTRFPTNKVCTAPINGPDVIRTFHAWTDAEPQLFMPGRDITPLIMNPDSEQVLDEWSQVPTMMTYVNNRYEPTEMATRLANEDWDACMYGSGVGYAPWYFMILVENYKYTRYAIPDRIEELYDLDTDPEELDNLALKVQFQPKLRAMRAACIQSIKDNGGLVFADLLPPPSTVDLWPAVYSSDNAHVLYGSGAAQPDGDVLKTKHGWGEGDSRMAYLRFDLCGVNKIGDYPADSILTVSLDLWMTQTEGDMENDLQAFALVDGAQDSPSSLSEITWTGSTGANPLLGTNLPQGNTDPTHSPLTTAMLGSHTFPATGDNRELGLLQIPLSVSDFKALIQNDNNGEITLIIRSTSEGLSADFASVNTTNSGQAVPTLTITALPAAPTNLEATAGDGSVLLDWDDNTEPNLSGYNVYRATAAGGFGATPLTNVTASAYADYDVVDETTYYYVVSAVDTDTNESPQSTEVSASPEEYTATPGTIYFGTRNEGLAGFATSTEVAGQTWSTETDSVRCRGEHTGHENTSLLRAFPFDRSAGNSYTIEGVVHLTDGYADDNNRVGIYLFGDSAEVPDEDEAGALCLLYNLDTGMVRLMQGIDRSQLTEASTGRSMDNSILGHAVRFTGEISFTGEAIQIVARFADELNATTTVSATVPAASYTGDYFGFATRGRSRHFGVTGDPQSAPFVMDFMSFRVTDTSVPALEGYVLWATEWGTDIGASTNDVEPDGLANWIEYALGGNPVSDDASDILPAASMGSDEGSNWLYYAYNRRIDAVTRGLTYTVLSGTNLVYGLSDVVPVVSVAPATNGFEAVTHRIATDAAPNGFITLNLEYQE